MVKSVSDSLRFMETLAGVQAGEMVRLGGGKVSVQEYYAYRCSNDSGDDVETLVKFASAAKEHSKRQGGGRYLFYSSEMNKGTLAVLRMEADLKKAFAKREFELHYQPKVDLATGRVNSVEALVRWRDGDGRLIGPGDFLDVADEADRTPSM